MLRKALFAISAYAVTGLVVLGWQKAAKPKPVTVAPADELAPLFI